MKSLKKHTIPLTKVDANLDEILDFLEENISSYSTTYYGGLRNKGYCNQKKYKEIIPEVLAKHSNSPNEFTSEFIRLLKEKFYA